ncbi:22415_t:CDS:2, partial [Dentiscutata erythropus]
MDVNANDRHHNRNEEFIKCIIDGVPFTTAENTRIPQQIASLALISVNRTSYIAIYFVSSALNSTNLCLSDI